MYHTIGKRLLDLTVTIPAVILLSPCLFLLTLLVRLTLGSPVLFRQQRPGRDGHPFTLLKFRTMTDARDAQGHLLPDGERLPPFGRFLRSTSLDELPELINVLRGEMSLVGPRPLLMQYLARYTPEQRRRHEVKPGITGWAQVNGRNALTWEQKFALDGWYVDHQSLGLDLPIIILTVSSPAYLCWARSPRCLPSPMRPCSSPSATTTPAGSSSIISNNWGSALSSPGILRR